MFNFNRTPFSSMTVEGRNINTCLNAVEFSTQLIESRIRTVANGFNFSCLSWRFLNGNTALAVDQVRREDSVD